MSEQNSRYFDQNEWNHLHDAVLTAMHKAMNRVELRQLFESLPGDLQAQALEHGCNDTGFRDNLIAYLQQNRLTLEDQMWKVIIDNVYVEEGGDGQPTGERDAAKLCAKFAQIHAVREKMKLVQMLYDAGIRGAGDLTMVGLSKELHKELEELGVHYG